MSTPKPSWAAPGFENASPQHEPVLLPVKGRIPSWLSGSLYRTGPGQFRIHPTSTANTDASPKPEVSVSHWFDGLGMNHQFKITSKGEVYYSNRSSSDGRIDYIQQTGRTPGSTFGNQQDPCKELFKKFFTTYVPHSDNPHTPSQPGRDMENVSVTLTPNIPGLSSHDNTKSSSATGLRYIVAATDSNWLQILDPETLEPLEITTYARIDPRLAGHLSAAHSCRDPSTGEHFNYVQKFGSTSSSYKVFRATPSRNPGEKAKVDILADITDAPMAYIHSFAMTKKYVVLSVWQSDYGQNGLAVFKNKNALSSIQKWNPNRDALFYVISRERGGVVAKYKAPTFFSFHTINAYETPSKVDPSKDDITIDIATYETNAVLDMLYLDHMRVVDPTGKSIEIPQARRYILSNILSTTTINSDTKSLPTNPAELAFTFSNIELPTIHPSFYYSHYRYAYGTHRAERHAPGVFTDKIVKLDMESQTEKTWGAEGYTTGEPIFVPRPSNDGQQQQAEDDGVVLSVVLDGVNQKSMLVVLDAKDMTEIARAEMDKCIPLGFHGYYAGNVNNASAKL
ncbi:hypothetical protein AGABI1DRAFT_80273 [Agaricus bisporus var. burnettii JB137-S8]|uniref:Carotenoid oxygenase n=1 Tax=Agaricus bisporus var. burnettii (strain JB137-S8 / ATCC MYA-4627 / FGSC 10392) TaxID=597362 RepID=K5XKZ0_AGABU|nr:uncharacterized protein AGABI1DRAFT_80273 [Agaricus bisporus var. burnettii JB137-S8]EKM75160.1 hypothetical protein AGABI1DRAFT_80273 [Agaricus bisporus var. burnettii JB137-S8]